MKTTLKRLVSALLVFALVFALLPSMAFAAKLQAKEELKSVEIPQSAYAEVDEDVWATIQAIEKAEVVEKFGADATAASYCAVLDKIIDAVESSKTYVAGSINRNGDFFTWETTAGVVCGYSPSLRAKMNKAAANEGVTPAIPSANVETVSYDTRATSAGAVDVALIEPYYGIDTSFTTQYQTEASSIASATGGTYNLYKTTAATIDAIADSLESCAVVIFDSHGCTDYETSSGDYVSQANTSYICLQTGTGFTTADQTSVTGTYGTYYHAYYAGSSSGSMKIYCADGTAIANHMESSAPNNLLWMAICLGQATKGLNSPLRAKGVGVVYGYSQSVSFTGDYKYENYFFTKLKAGSTVATSASYMKSAAGCNWDPAYSSYSQTQAVNNYVAFPIVVSDQDTYPGQGNVDAVQTVKSTWTLADTTGGSSSSSYTVTATSNNTSYGTVSVSGYTITASPKTGYYVSGYTVTSGTATVSQSGNTFTVTPSSNCTVQINFAASQTTTTYTVSFSGATASSVSCTSGSSVTLPTPTSTVSGYTFVGWTTSKLSSDTTTKPTYYAAGSSYTPTANTTLYALYSYTKTSTSSGSTTTTSSWNLVTSASDLTSGSTYVIAANTRSYVAGALSSSYLKAVSATFSSDKSTITTLPSTATQFTLGGSTGAWTLTSSSGKLAASAAKKVNLSGTGTSTWSITIASTGTATITNGTTSYGSLKFNTLFPRFTTYTSSQTAVQLYKLTTTTSGGGSTTTTTTYYTSTASGTTDSGSSGSGSSTTTGKTYTLVTTAPSSWDGDYVIVGLSGSTYYVLNASGTYTGTTLGSTSAVKTLSAAGITKSGNTLSNVSDDYVFTAEQYSSTGYYSFKMKGSSNYLAYRASGLNSYSSLTYTSQLWGLSVASTGKATMSNYASSSYHLGFNASSKLFRCYTSSSYTVYLFKAN